MAFSMEFTFALSVVEFSCTVEMNAVPNENTIQCIILGHLLCIDKITD